MKKKGHGSITALRSLSHPIVHRAAYWKRVLAYLADMLVLMAVVVFPLTGSWDTPTGDWSTVPFLMIVVAAVLIVAYFTILEYRYGQTIGKMLLGLRVTGNRGFASLLLRNVVKFSLLLVVLDCAGFFFKKERRRFTEYWSETWVEDVHEPFA